MGRLLPFLANQATKAHLLRLVTAAQPKEATPQRPSTPRLPYLQRAIQVVQAQADLDQGQGVKGREAIVVGTAQQAHIRLCRL